MQNLALTFLDGRHPGYGWGAIETNSVMLNALIAQGDQWAGKLDDQDDGKKHRGRKLSDSGAKARFYHAVCEAHLSRIIQVDMAAQQFSYDIDEGARTLAERMDGKLLLVTNVQDLSPAEVVTRYKSLADIERGFKVLKSELEIGATMKVGDGRSHRRHPHPHHAG